MSVPVLAGISAGAFTGLACVEALQAGLRPASTWRQKLTSAAVAATLAAVLGVAAVLAW